MVNEIKLTSQFKKQTSKAVSSILLFIIIYFILCVFAVALTVLCIYAGIQLIITFPRIITIIVGVGLASLGVLVLVFLLKFIFKSNKIDRSNLIELTRKDEPTLFKMIDKIVIEVDTSFPKKVYLSGDVNASVFYDSSFWSMFFPVKKNLLIGLGLVNSVTTQELQAVLAHEFGHFSQKTMKVGSYVYNVNQVIYNLLYDNEGYDKLANSWASINGYIAIFVMLAMKIIQLIQWVLKKMYDLVNKSYMGLSREMEFHADEIAAHVSGSEPLKTSLLRLQLAEYAYNSVFEFYHNKVSENLKSQNIFNEHSFVLNFLAKKNKVQITNELPKVTLEELYKFNKSKLVIEDQWASHPSTKDRVDRLDQLNLPIKEANNNPANDIFENITEIQKKLTEQSFKHIEYKNKITLLDPIEFQKEFKANLKANSFSNIYNGYYDDKNPILFNTLKNITLENKETKNDLFSDSRIDSVYTYISLESDLEMIKQISNKTIPIKTFDYDGIKYSRKQSLQLIKQLESQLTTLKTELQQNDIEIYQYFYNNAQADEQDELKLKYDRFFEFDEQYDKRFDIVNMLNQSLQFLNETTPYDQIKANFVSINTLELKLKEQIKTLMEDENFNNEISADIKENFDLYLSKKWTYFHGERYYEQSLEVLFNAVNNYSFLLSRAYFTLKKDLLDFQSSIPIK